jgi:predicted DCC family thiol-disulfide oxidoreductase YuxK
MLVLWDRDCGFCAWTLALALRADRRRVLVTSTIQEADVAGLLDAIEPERRYASFHIVDADGRVTSAGRAVTVMLGLLPAGRPLGLVTNAAPKLTERAYRWVAEHRSLLSKPIPRRSKDRARRLVADRAG